MFVVYMKFCSWIIPLVFFNPTTVESFYLSRANFLRNTGTSVLGSGATIYNWSSNNNGPEEEEHSIRQTADASYPLTVNFYSPVTIESCMALTNYLKQLDVKSKQLQIQYGTVFPINLHIQSGGDVDAHIYVCDVIHNLDTQCVYIDGFVASAASLIAVLGKKIHDTAFIHVDSSAPVTIIGTIERNER